MYDRALLVDDPLFDEHRADGPHPERPERLHAARGALERLHERIDFERLRARDPSEDELVRVHTPEYLALLGRSAGHRGMLDADTFLAPRSVAAAHRAAGAALTLTESVLRGDARWGVALVRPPGHHARPDAAMGFCLLNNVAVAAAQARCLGAERVLVLDWDVHHGNGTQEMFYSDPSVLYVSLHQYPYYPGTGAAEELGQGDGRGYTVNVPLSAGAGDAEYAAAFERIVCPIVETYRPDLVLLSAGFDAHARDPLGGMTLTDEGYRMLTRALLAVVSPTCPWSVVLEGGYDLAGLAGALEATCKALTGNDAPVVPPGAPSTTHSREIEKTRALLGQYWDLG